MPKLVRDFIPQIIAANQEVAVIHQAEEAEYGLALDQKLLEETNEYLQIKKENSSMARDQIIEEIADIQEVIQAILKYHGITKTEVDLYQQTKAAQKGSFELRIILEDQ